jgi:hypothetical protein
LRFTHVGEHAVQIEHDGLGCKHRGQRAREALEVGRITRQRDS